METLDSLSLVSLASVSAFVQVASLVALQVFARFESSIIRNIQGVKPIGAIRLLLFMRYRRLLE